MNNNVVLSPNAAKYKNARLSLLLVLIFSVLNLIMMFSNTYLLFSARIPLVIATVGLIMHQDTMEVIYLVITIALAVITLIPYLLCWLFSKKRVGWMIAALVIFSVDTVFLLIDVPSYLASGDFSIFIDVIIHGIIIYELAVGVSSGFKLKTEAALQQQAEEQAAKLAEQAGEQTEESGEPVPEETRVITVTRKKSFVGCANPIVVYVNNQAACRIKNGQTEKITVPVTEFQLGAALPNGFAANTVIVPNGYDTPTYSLQIKMGFSSSTILINREI